MSEETKIVRALPPRGAQGQDKAKILKQYLMGLVGVSFSFVILLILVSILPMAGYIKITSLLLGAFLILDIHHSLKLYVGRTINN
jgi:hypothetical protein